MPMANETTELDEGSTPFSQCADDELVRWVVAEERTEAFTELVRRHEGRIRHLLLRLTKGDRVLTEDLTQESFLRAYRGLASFEGRSAFGTWLHRIAYYAFLNHRNRSPRHHSLPEGFENVFEAPEGDLSPRRSDLRRDMTAAVASLPDHYREVILMHFVRHVPYRDIASELGLPLGTVKTQLYRAKALLRDRMDGWAIASHRPPSCPTAPMN